MQVGNQLVVSGTCYMAHPTCLVTLVVPINGSGELDEEGLLLSNSMWSSKMWPNEVMPAMGGREMWLVSLGWLWLLVHGSVGLTGNFWVKGCHEGNRKSWRAKLG